jgi:hypothetical protein
MENWWSGFTGGILLTRKLVNERLPYKLAECSYGLKSIFQSSIIPCVRQKNLASRNSLVSNRL